MMHGENKIINPMICCRKREAEMAKLRKLLEDVHTESEQQIHQLRYTTPPPPSRTPLIGLTFPPRYNPSSPPSYTVFVNQKYTTIHSCLKYSIIFKMQHSCVKHNV